MTLQEPRWIQPSCCAAPRERSSCFPLTKGPLSLIRTITDLLLYVKCSFVPNGRFLCAAVIPLGLNRSPFAVFFPCMYHEAVIVPVAASEEVVAQPANSGTPIHNDITRSICFPFNGGQGRTQTLNLSVRSRMLYSVELPDLKIIKKFCTVMLQRVSKENCIIVWQKLLNEITSNIVRNDNDPTHIHFLLLWRGRRDSNSHS